MKKNIIISVSIVGLALASFTLGSNLYLRTEEKEVIKTVEHKAIQDIDNIDMDQVTDIETDGNGNFLITLQDGSGYAWETPNDKSKVKHTFQNVAIYNSGSIIDEDGEQFYIDFNCPDDSTLLVTYDNNNTVTRLDDTPIEFEVLEAN